MPYRILKSKNSLEDNRFKSISDFKWCMKCGGEVEIEWNGIHYGIIRYGTDDKITIYVWNCPRRNAALTPLMMHLSTWSVPIVCVM